MALLSLVRVASGQVNVLPGDVKMIATDNLATITAAGYLGNGVTSAAYSIALSQSDVIECLYNFDPSNSSGTLIYFQPVIVNGVITLNPWENPGNVLLPVNDGQFAIFNGTTGQIKDAGYLPSDDTQTFVVMAGPVTPASRLVKFLDNNGTVYDAGVSLLANTLTYAGGAASNAFAYPGVTTTSIITATLMTSANVVTLLTATPTLNTLTITFTADPGASTIGVVVMNP